MNLHVIQTGYFKLDGGAMFGVVPKSIWQRTNPADDNNLCSWAMRCLLVEDGNRLVLIDTGVGDKQSEKFFSYYYLHGEESLMSSLKKAGFGPEEVTDVILTHLHFDHCRGAVKRIGEEKYTPAFPNARYWSNADHWNWAENPNPRERASFLQENFKPLESNDQLKFLNPGQESPFNKISVLYMDGHTEKQMLPKIQYKGRTLVFAADLIPSVGHIPLAYVMGYDVRPLITMKEKDEFLKEAARNNYILYFEHDPVNECCTVKETERGIRVHETFPLKDLI
ncbi:MAG: MBL fold metallo-hydrolase [Cyclobacteriaceae bacterium]|nr:MBL fold metallo-hydrolase [Cyclobacteriaceae bacterium]